MEIVNMISRKELLEQEYTVTSSTSLTSRKKLNKTSSTSSVIKERALHIAGDLAKTEPNDDLTDWYCKAYKTLGESRYEAIAKMARSGQKPKNLFGWLLKRAMGESDQISV